MGNDRRRSKIPPKKPPSVTRPRRDEPQQGKASSVARGPSTPAPPLAPVKGRQRASNTQEVELPEGDASDPNWVHHNWSENYMKDYYHETQGIEIVDIGPEDEEPQSNADAETLLGDIGPEQTKWDFLINKKKGDLSLGYINLQGMGRTKRVDIGQLLQKYKVDIFASTEHHVPIPELTEDPKATVKDCPSLKIKGYNSASKHRQKNTGGVAIHWNKDLKNVTIWEGAPSKANL
jgi:hypothetical protein